MTTALDRHSGSSARRYQNHKNATPPAKIASQTSESRKYRVGRFIGSALPMDGLMEHQVFSLLDLDQPAASLSFLARRHGPMSDLRPQCAHERTFANAGRRDQMQSEVPQLSAEQQRAVYSEFLKLALGKSSGIEEGRWDPFFARRGRTSQALCRLLAHLADMA